MSQKFPRRPSASIVLPNLITTGNLFFGFFSIVKCLQGEFAWAATAILLAAIFDVLDGRVARLTKGTSEFGVQYDSLCDLVSFGLAPAFLMYQFGLRDLGRFGWIVCFLFLACGALRLARFNVQSSVGKASGDFTGLPIPMAGISIACFVAFMSDLAKSGDQGFWVLSEISKLLPDRSAQTIYLAVIGPILAFMMVSSVTYRSHKTIHIKGVNPFRLLVGAVTALALVAFQPELMGFLITFFYTLSGPVEYLLGWKKASDDDDDLFSSSDNDGQDSFEVFEGQGSDTRKDSFKRQITKEFPVVKEPN
jgi:CDP-diacylglycerol--serine O-phosphatidyltransferase